MRLNWKRNEQNKEEENHENQIIKKENQK